MRIRKGMAASMTIHDLLAALHSLPHRAITPNVEQLAVMRYNAGPLHVIAGPGTGKTEALILRCLRLLCVDRVPPESIVLTTYTRKAARQLEQRLHLMLAALGEIFPGVREIDVSRMRIGTLHSICWDLLTETPASPFRHLQRLDELERAFFVRTHSTICRRIDSPALLQLLSWAQNPDQPAASQGLPSSAERGRLFIELCQRLVEDQVDRESFAQAVPSAAPIIELIAEYESKLRDYHFTDNTFVQQQALELLRSDEGAALVRAAGEHLGIQHVIVDEYQDTNPLQAALYRELAGRPPHHLCVVGDDDQALYRFRGGTVSCMVRFADECRTAWPSCRVEPVQLARTYRSHPEIVRWINSFVVAHPQMKLPYARVADKAPLTPDRPEHPDDRTVWVIRGKDAKEVAANFAAALRQLIDQQVIASPSQCALLARSIKAGPRALGPYLDALREQGILSACADQPKERLLYRKVLGTLLVALDPHGNLMPAGFAARDRALSSYVDRCRKEALPDIADRIHTWLVSRTNTSRSATVSDLAWQIVNTRDCMDLLETDPEEEAAASVLIQTLDAYDRVAREGHHSISLDEENRCVDSRWMRRFYEVLVEELFRDRDKARQADEDIETSVRTDKLQVLTIHGAKGLQFPVVAVVVDGNSKGKPDKVHRLERAVLPFRRDLPPTGIAPYEILGGPDEARAAQDAIRLQYVGYSRAQEVLLLLVPDPHRAEPRALGVGPTEEWLQQHIKAEWPARSTRRQQQKPKPDATEGEHQLVLFE
jgi:DNA helicase-2/ATP-dependent DNA helicase PcrA